MSRRPVVARVAALFVDGSGCYAGLPDVDVWDRTRDARQYAGPHPVVAHPPCERWGRYAAGGPAAKVRRTPGDDGGCFAAALASVRRWGGVLEHPQDSRAWARFDLNTPRADGQWTAADWFGGWTCRAEQGHYGHRARKPTWLYACRVVDLPRLVRGVSDASEFCERLSKRQRAATPAPFRELLLSIARAARTGGAT